MIGSKLIEMSFPKNHQYDKETIERFRKIFTASSKRVQNLIIINGTINLLYENFTGKDIQKFVEEFLLEKEKKHIIRRKFVRYK